MKKNITCMYIIHNRKQYVKNILPTIAHGFQKGSSKYGTYSLSESGSIPVICSSLKNTINIGIPVRVQYFQRFWRFSFCPFI